MHALWSNPVPIGLGVAQPQPDASTLPPATLEAPLFQPRDWAAAFTSQTGEFEYWLDEVEGRVPEHLRGTLFRNGPGMFGARPAGRPKSSVCSQSSSVSAAMLTQGSHAIGLAVGADTQALGGGPTRAEDAFLRSRTCTAHCLYQAGPPANAQRMQASVPGSRQSADARML